MPAEKNISSLSPGCQTAVRAVGSTGCAESGVRASRAKAESTPAAAPAKPAAETEPPPAAKAAASTDGQEARPVRRLPRSAARAVPTIKKVCAGVPTRRRSGTCNVWNRTSRKFRAPCQQAVGRRQRRPCEQLRQARLVRQLQRRRSCRRPRQPRLAPALVLLRPLRPREEVFVLRSACGGDVRSPCGGGSTRRWPDRAMPGYKGSLALAGLQGSSEPVRRAIDSDNTMLCRKVLASAAIIWASQPPS